MLFIYIGQNRVVRHSHPNPVILVLHVRLWHLYLSPLSMCAMPVHTSVTLDGKLRVFSKQRMHLPECLYIHRHPYEQFPELSTIFSVSS